MELSKVFRQAAEITFGRRWLWLPALLFTLALDLPSLLFRPFAPSLADLTNPEKLEAFALILSQFTTNIPQLVLALAVFSVVFGALWAAATIGQAVLIDGVSAVHAGLEQEKITHWKRGRSLLGRFIAIDTLVLFPLFLVLLFILLSLGGIAASLALTLRGGGTLAISPMVGIFGALLIPLVCLILPTMIGAVVYRLIAFRFAALQHMFIRDAVRAVRPFVRQHFVNILLLFLLTGVVYYVINGVVISLGGGMRWLIPTGWPSGLKFSFEAVLFGISLIASLFRNLFLSACWTIGMLELED